MVRALPATPPLVKAGTLFLIPETAVPLGIKQVLSEYLTLPFQGTEELETAKTKLWKSSKSNTCVHFSE